MSADPYQFLRKVSLFADLPDRDLEALCQGVREVQVPAGEVLFSEGNPSDKVYVIQTGQVEIYKESDGLPVQLAIRQPGDVIGEIGILEGSPRTAGVRALSDTTLLAITNDRFEDLLKNSPSASRVILTTIINRLRTTELMLHQSEKMAQLGTLSAGIAHELNNPASAVSRGAEQLKQALARTLDYTSQMAGLDMDSRQRSLVQSLQNRQQNIPETAASLEALERNDREAEIEEWLDGVGIKDAWEIAPSIVDIGITQDELVNLGDSFSPSTLRVILCWLAANQASSRLINEITQGASRITDIVKALKSYVYLDQAAVQEVDIHEGLDNSLVILRHKLKQGVEIHRDYGKDIPRVLAYGGELNQVWTNIIDNAIDAMDGNGQITIHTRLRSPWVIVDIQDNGPGIPAEIQPKLFNPFFTTKPLGKGTGLGLNITYNIVKKHRGDIKVFSHPGETHFEVRLPVNFEESLSGKTTLASIHHPDDASLENILKKVKTIAVVGISDDPQNTAYQVPEYLLQQGYTIYPVNAQLERVFGQRAYPQLRDVPKPVDEVLIFLESKDVPEIVEEAIEIGAGVVWMQEGILNEPAAQRASQAGLEVVMDTCMRSTHRRFPQHTDGRNQ